VKTKTINGRRVSSRDPERYDLKDWLLSLYLGDHGRLVDHYGSEPTGISVKAAMTGSSGTLGGYTVPMDLYHELITPLHYQPIVRSGARCSAC
jgi:hypothetical protein